MLVNVRLVLRTPAAAVDVKHDRRRLGGLRQPHIHRLSKVRPISHIDEGRGRGIGFVGGVEFAHLGGWHPVWLGGGANHLREHGIRA